MDSKWKLMIWKMSNRIWKEKEMGLDGIYKLGNGWIRMLRDKEMGDWEMGRH